MNGKPRPEYPIIPLDEIRVGDVVRLSGVSTTMPYILGTFEILKAKPIGKGRIQIKFRDIHWKGATVRKADLKIGPMIGLVKREGKDMNIHA